VAEPVEVILLRQWASYLNLPIWIMDDRGSLIFYNEAAEALIGRRFEESGEIAVEDLAAVFSTRDETGAPLGPGDLPISVALMERRPSHRRLLFEGLDGRQRLVEITAFPITGLAGRSHGAVAIFWEAG
jgi:PAS domain-containing protein